MGILLLVALAEVWIFTRGGSSPEETAAERPDLRPEEVMGCYALRIGPWRVVSASPPVADPDSGPAGSPEPPGKGAGVPDSLPPELEPPARVALLPDSADIHGRDLPSFRAEAIPAGERPGRVLRWTVRADTMWLVWTEPGARAGAALFAAGDSLAGAARGVTEAADVSAPAVAWPINCSTLGRERRGERPRP